MDIQLGMNGVFELADKAEKFLVSVLWLAMGNNLTASNFQCCK
jgi:hypothetical protein